MIKFGMPTKDRHLKNGYKQEIHKRDVNFCFVTVVS